MTREGQGGVGLNSGLDGLSVGSSVSRDNNEQQEQPHADMSKAT